MAHGGVGGDGNEHGVHAGYGGRGELVDYHLTGRVVAVSDL